MAHRIAASTLNASTVDVMNVIRQNASMQYQNSIPTVADATDIPRVGELIYGTPAFANEFINALVNRIAFVAVQAATFNNPYVRLKKGVLDYGETVEEIFVNIAKVYEFSQDKAAGREFKQYKPDVRSAFHAMNWRVLYPITISDEELRMAFLSADGVTNLIAKIVDSIYTAASYDEFLLFKYLLIKSVNRNLFFVTGATGSPNTTAFAKIFRGTSNKLPFMSSLYNAAKVKTTTPKERQCIFMDAQFNADFDVDVLASAFNMDKADFMGRLYLIDDWTTFDNERWEEIRAECEGVEEVTAGELTAMAGVKAIIMDSEWFQIYDNLNRMTEKFVASGLRWNYFYHTWKTISWSPFANAVVVMDGASSAPTLTSITLTLESYDESAEKAVAAAFRVTNAATSGGNIGPVNVTFDQTEDMTELGVAMTKEGTLLSDGTNKVAPDGTQISGGSFAIVVDYNGKKYASPDVCLLDAEELTIYVDGDMLVKAGAGQTYTLSPVT